VGGPAAVNEYLKSIGTSGINVQDSEKTLGIDARTQYRNYADPRALVSLLRLIADHSPLSPEHTQLLLGWMTNASTSNNRIKGLLPVGTVVAHKTGTSRAVTNDVGLITLPDGQRLAIAILVTDSPESVEVRESVIARITEAVWSEATHPPRVNP